MHKAWNDFRDIIKHNSANVTSQVNEGCKVHESLFLRLLAHQPDLYNSKTRVVDQVPQISNFHKMAS